jgi:hypothetical protein
VLTSSKKSEYIGQQSDKLDTLLVCTYPRKKHQKNTIFIQKRYLGFSPYQELMQNFMSIMHCFSARLYFWRKYEKKFQQDMEEEVQNLANGI